MSNLLPAVQDTEVSTVPRIHSPLLKKKMPGLDVLRGLAVLAVFAFHGLSWQIPAGTVPTPTVHRIAAVAAGGWLGVNLFFVLSGFLITGILLDTRTRPNYWSSFYVRRVLRILPLYLVVLLLLTFVDHFHPAYILMCLFYVANMTVYFHHVGPGYGPLWSLAVEEQFYLVWPLIILFVSRRTLAFLCLALMVLCPVLRGLAAGPFPWLGDPYSTTWLVMDNLAWGALLAVFLRSSYASSKNVKAFTLSLSLGSLLLLGVFGKLHWLNRTTPLGASMQIVPFLILFCALLLFALRYGDQRYVQRWSAPIRFFGYISYGLYLLHVAFFYFHDLLRARYAPFPGILTARIFVIRFFIVLAAGSLICWLSRRFFEERFLLLKERLVPYGKRPGLQPGK